MLIKCLQNSAKLEQGVPFHRYHLPGHADVKSCFYHDDWILRFDFSTENVIVSLKSNKHLRFDTLTATKHVSREADGLPFPVSQDDIRARSLSMQNLGFVKRARAVTAF